MKKNKKILTYEDMVRVSAKMHRKDYFILLVLFIIQTIIVLLILMNSMGII